MAPIISSFICQLASILITFFILFTYACCYIHYILTPRRKTKLIILLELKEFEPSLVFMIISLQEFKEHLNVDIANEC